MAAHSDNFTVLKHGLRRVPLHAYTTWLVEDRINQRVQRRVGLLCQRWRVWARACHTVKQVWARKLGGLAQQMFTCWKDWVVKRSEGRAEVHRRLDREVEKAVSAAQIAAHHYKRRGGMLGIHPIAPLQLTSPTTCQRLSSEFEWFLARSGDAAYDPRDVGGGGRGSPNGGRDHVRRLQERADFAQRQQAAARQGTVHVSQALQTVADALGGAASLPTGSMPRRGSPSRLSQEHHSPSRTQQPPGAQRGRGQRTLPSRLHATTGSPPKRQGTSRAGSRQLPPM